MSQHLDSMPSRSEVSALDSNKANYLFIDATAYGHNSKTGWDFAYGKIPDGYNGILKINFNNGYNTVCTAYRQNSSWGSIMGHENSDHVPFFYNVNFGTSTLDELALNSKLTNTTPTVTKTTNIKNNSSVVAKKYGNIVSIYLDVYAVSNETGYIDIASIAEAPNAIVYFLLIDANDNAAMARLTANGVLQIHNTVADKNYMGSLTYVSQS